MPAKQQPLQSLCVPVDECEGFHLHRKPAVLDAWTNSQSEVCLVIFQ